jgi:hypothetical protein
MKKSEIANAKDVYSLRELYRKHNPKSTTAKCEYWINKIMQHREGRK